MGQAKVGVGATQRADAERLETEIAALREELGSAVDELDRRRRELLDLPLQLRKHATPVLIVAGVAGLALTAAVTLSVLHRRREQRPMARLRRARRAAERAIEHPDQVARGEPSLPLKLATATLTALAGAMAKRLVEQATHRPAAILPEVHVRDVAIAPEMRV